MQKRSSEPDKTEQNKPPQKETSSQPSSQDEAQAPGPASGASTAPRADLPPGALSLNDIQESQARLAEPKRKRGRPRKSPGPDASTPLSSSTETPPEPVQIPTEVLAVGLKYPFSLVARLRKCPAWELPDAQATEMAPLLDQVLKQYCPQLESRHAALISLALALAAHSVTAFMAEKAPEEIPAPNTEPTPIEVNELASHGLSPLSFS